MLVHTSDITLLKELENMYRVSIESYRVIETPVEVWEDEKLSRVFV